MKPNCTSHILSNCFADHEAKTDSVRVQIVLVFHFPEILEQLFRLLVLDPDPRILKRNSDHCFRFSNLFVHNFHSESKFSRLSILQRIGDEVGQNLFDPLAVPNDCLVLQRLVNFRFPFNFLLLQRELEEILQHLLDLWNLEL